MAGHAGDAEGARALLADAEPAVRATALAALERLGAARDDEVAAAVADPSPAVRRRAAEVAIGHPSVSITGLLDDRDPSVVEQAAWACGERAVEKSVVGRLAALVTGHRDALVREAAVAALGALGDADGLPAVLAATADRVTVRRRAVLALAPFEGADVDAALERARADPDWQVRQAAEDLLEP